MEITKPLFNIEDGSMLLTEHGINMIHNINKGINKNADKDYYSNILCNYLNIKES